MNFVDSIWGLAEMTFHKIIKHGGEISKSNK